MIKLYNISAENLSNLNKGLVLQKLLERKSKPLKLIKKKFVWQIITSLELGRENSTGVTRNFNNKLLITTSRFMFR